MPRSPGTPRSGVSGHPEPLPRRLGSGRKRLDRPKMTRLSSSPAQAGGEAPEGGGTARISGSFFHRTADPTRTSTSHPSARISKEAGHATQERSLVTPVPAHDR